MLFFLRWGLEDIPNQVGKDGTHESRTFFVENYLQALKQLWANSAPCMELVPVIPSKRRAQGEEVVRRNWPALCGRCWEFGILNWQPLGLAWIEKMISPRESGMLHIGEASKLGVGCI